MRKFTLTRIILFMCVIVTGVTACKKDDPATLIPPPLPDQSFVEEFDTVASAYHRGWMPINNSSPRGYSLWSQGGGPQPYFAPYSSKGSYAGFIACDALVTEADAAVASNWLISPPVWMKNGDKIVFYTRAVLFLDGSFSQDYGNNLEVCINRKNDGTNVGAAVDPRSPGFDYAADRGDFELIHSINPPTYSNADDWFYYRISTDDPAAYDPKAYPANWTRFEITLAGFSKPHKGRFAFRYYTLDAGYTGNGSAVGIDSVAFVSKQ
ncbi:hypothetical protein HB364_24285 [Pseudoflavitalea sp. X16]|uniref:choice-of-anchor J domain-containing protein n=1 Tax=Paraflavitalea devenefica TaxID=2716334 RepID=UPI00142407A1|nr:choice-of-anchor J domain-containing protein [Paraflavitalea devenefica]NII28224.1 hypothetical protein [Paraflavitalea devenefica]